MLIEDPAAFSLVVPTLNGTALLKRTLDYFAAIDFGGQVVIADSSPPPHRAFVESCPQRYPGLRIRAFFHAESIRFIDKLVETLKQLPSRCVLLHANDDFVVPESLEQCLHVLETMPDYAVARGRAVTFKFERKGDEVDVKTHPYAMRAHPQADPLERVLTHLESFTATFYSVHRRHALIESLGYAEAHTKNIVFLQYLSSAVAALQGRIYCSDRIFYVRQTHARSWFQEVRDTYEHWPRLATSPHYSRYYGEFRQALCALVAARTGIDEQAFGERLDTAFIRLLRRSFGGLEALEPEEQAFRNRLMSADSPDRERIEWILDFCQKYPDTY